MLAKEFEGCVQCEHTVGERTPASPQNGLDALSCFCTVQQFLHSAAVSQTCYGIVSCNSPYCALGAFDACIMETVANL